MKHTNHDLLPAVRCDLHAEHSPALTAGLSWFETIGLCRCVTAACVTEGDGYHAHVYTIGDPIWWRIRITEHRHAWMAEHLTTHPDAHPITIEHERAETGTHALAAAWQSIPEVTGVPLPAIGCADQCPAEGCAHDPAPGREVYNSAECNSAFMRQRTAAACGRCGCPLPADTEALPREWIHAETLSPLDTTGRAVDRRSPEAVHVAICPACTRVRAKLTADNLPEEVMPALWPRTRWSIIDDPWRTI